MIREMKLRQRCSRRPLAKFSIGMPGRGSQTFVRCHFFLSRRRTVHIYHIFAPVFQFPVRERRTPNGAHPRSQPVPPLHLQWIAVRIMTNRNSFTRDKSRIERPRLVGRPLHAGSIPKHPRLGIRCHFVESPPQLNRTRAVRQDLRIGLILSHFTACQPEEMPEEIHSGFMGTHFFAHETGRRDFIEFVGIHL